MDINVDAIMRNLAKKGYKVTAPRKIILESMLENEKKHISIDDIYDSTRKKDKKIGISTIYRTIDLLEKTGVIQKHDFAGKQVRYEFVQENDGDHHHLICKKCGKIIEVEGLMPINLEDLLIEKYDFKMEDCILEINGYCKECLAQENKAEK